MMSWIKLLVGPHNRRQTPIEFGMTLKRIINRPADATEAGRERLHWRLAALGWILG
jgi:hypothetical protein